MRVRVLKVLSETMPDINFREEKNLVDNGILDSLDMTLITEAFNEEFCLDIDVLEVDPACFNDLDSMTALVVNAKKELES